MFANGFSTCIYSPWKASFYVRVFDCLAADPRLTGITDASLLARSCTDLAYACGDVLASPIPMEEKLSIARAFDVILRANAPDLMESERSYVLDIAWREVIRAAGPMEQSLSIAVRNTIAQAAALEPELNVGLEWALDELDRTTPE